MKLKQILKKAIKSNEPGIFLGIQRKSLRDIQSEIYNLNIEIKKRFYWEFTSPHEVIDIELCDLLLKVTKLPANINTDYFTVVLSCTGSPSLIAKPPGSICGHSLGTFSIFSNSEREKMLEMGEVFNNHAHYICPHCWDSYPGGPNKSKLDLLLQQINLKIHYSNGNPSIPNKSNLIKFPPRFHNLQNN